MSKETALITALEKLLASSYTLYLKTQNYHWNVTGPHFSAFHTMFQGQYEELAMAIDEIAERIRALGHLAPGSYQKFAELSAVREELGTPGAMEMIENLAGDHKTLAKAASEVITAAQALSDEASADLGIKRLDVHQKTQWMLNAHLA